MELQVWVAMEEESKAVLGAFSDFYRAKGIMQDYEHETKRPCILVCGALRYELPDEG